MRVFLSLMLIGGLEACTPEQPAKQAAEGILEANRDYSYHIGDLISLTYDLPLQGHELDPRSMAPDQQSLDGFVIRKVEVIGPLDTDRNLTRVGIEYQILKGTQDIQQVTIPEMKIRMKDQPAFDIKIPAWTFTLLPVIPPGASNEEIEPQEGLPFQSINSQAYLDRLWTWLLFLSLVLMLLIIQRRVLARRVMPFRASKSAFIAAIQPGCSQQQRSEGFRALHHAFDQTKGSILFRSDIEQFIRSHPAFRGIESDLLLFFTYSSSIFFDPSAEIEFTEKDRSRLIALLNQCIRAEHGS